MPQLFTFLFVCFNKTHSNSSELMQRHLGGSAEYDKSSFNNTLLPNGEQSYNPTIFSHVFLKYHSSLSRRDTSLFP